MITSYPSTAHSLTHDSPGFSASTAGLGRRPRRGFRRAKVGTPILRAESPTPSDLNRYLPLRGDEGQTTVCVAGIGRAQVRPGDAYPVGDPPKLYRMDWHSGRVLPDMQLLLLTDARGEFESRETGHVRIDGHALVFLLPGVWHRFRPDRNFGWTERWISMNSFAAQYFIGQGVVDRHCQLMVSSNLDQAIASFDALAEYVEQHPNGQSARLSEAAINCVLAASGCRDQVPREQIDGDDTSEQSTTDVIVDQAREIIWNHGHLRTVCVSDVAKQLPVTRRTLDRRFAQSVGHSVLDEINSCRLWRAKQLLEETDLLIKTIAYLAGFPSRERMRLLFICDEGVTPSEYRERVRSPAR